MTVKPEISVSLLRGETSIRCSFVMFEGYDMDYDVHWYIDGIRITGDPGTNNFITLSEMPMEQAMFNKDVGSY